METARLVAKNNENAYVRPLGGGGTLTGAYPLTVRPDFQQAGYAGAVQMNKEPQRVICPTCRAERVRLYTVDSA